jgi:hypothetical protein
MDKGAFSTFVLYRPLTRRLKDGALAQKLSRIGDWGGLNLDAV